MSASIFIAGMLCGGCVVAVSGTAGSFFGKWLAKKDEAPERRSVEPPRNNQSRWQWHAMPCGTRLELGDTGFWIRLVGKKGEPAFIGYDPEGDAIISGNNLAGMKDALEQQAKYLEQQAKYRAEFAPEPQAWRLP